MELHVEEKNLKIIKIEGLRTLCPYREQNKEDYTNLEIGYVLGSSEIDKAALEDFIKTKIYDKEIAMELIPLKILWFLIKTSLAHRHGRYAAPEMVRISSRSSGKAKGWSMNINLEFRRKITE